MKCVGLIDHETWLQILVERQAKQKVRKLSDAEITIRRLVKEMGTNKVLDLVRGEQCNTKQQ